MQQSQVDLKLKMRQAAEQVDGFLLQHFQESPSIHPELLKAMRYSLLQKAAKRFRASLVLLTAEALGAPVERVLPFAAALECVHTYSLIHDDLPSLDNDDFRRGELTNHKLFGEATALLAGDALLTEAFAILAKYFVKEAKLAIELVGELAQAAGMQGMISGQMRDLMSAKVPIENIEQLRFMHQQKTGALILVAVTGAARLCSNDHKDREDLKNFAASLGLAFQVKDDLLDYEQDQGASYPGLMGVEAAKNF